MRLLSPGGAGRRRPAPGGLVLERGERVLAASPVDDGGSAGAVAAATTSALVLLRNGAQEWRFRWHELDSGVWDGDDRVLRLAAVDGQRAVLHLDDDAGLDLAVVTRDRLQASVVATRHARLGEGPSVRVSVRQVQGGPDAGRLLVQESVPAGARVGSELRALVLTRRHELEDAVGLPRSG